MNVIFEIEIRDEKRGATEFAQTLNISEKNSNGFTPFEWANIEFSNCRNFWLEIGVKKTVEQYLSKNWYFSGRKDDKTYTLKVVTPND